MQSKPVATAIPVVQTPIPVSASPQQTQNVTPASSTTDATSINEVLQHDIEESMKLATATAPAQIESAPKPEPIKDAVLQSDPIEDITEKLNEQLEEKLESASHPLIKPKEVVRPPAPVPPVVPKPVAVVQPVPKPVAPVAPPAPTAPPQPPTPKVEPVMPPTAPPATAGKTMIATHRTPRIQDAKPVSTALPQKTDTRTYAESAAPKKVAVQPQPLVEPVVEQVVDPAPTPPAPGTSFAPASPIKMPQPEAELKDDTVTQEAPINVEPGPTLKPGEIRIDKDGNVITG
jgi:hypothetical protein